MRNFIIGLTLGLVLGGGIAWAAMEITLVSANGTAVGTAANPLVVKGE